ncbi:HlyD family type I secretion periplasmic adaptor subunit [Nitrosomonas sp. Is24]|uniref:HlyD family type I secretion periplasmic adaptor subunit n=1 Tax=Nitrosomonas sp. Is24 TaxID=3080533 RepID=UPI001045A36F|nr:HlyD family type I secretion periplasmic adaptor subunit [Nitrosomonas sp. Is24]MDV6340419.1 HlyD family type I secretion periplasmic adaptor subunit [Nitrosomonas sp. Is24]MDV6342455.1 HlyD family type I secretion periplasmic adaptor subunit [Nitrosomonas sp. Is24]
MKLAAEEKKTVIENVPADLSHQVDTDETLHTKLGWWIVLAGFGGFILWASFAPLDKGVPVPGTVTVASHLQAVQHQIGGIIDSILVKEGEHVAVGQVLVRMNDVQLKAQAEITRSQLYTARAVEARLLAERDGSKEITFPQDLLTFQHDPRIANNIITQNQLFTSRQLALHHEIAALEENIAGSRMQLRGLEASRSSKNAQLKFLEEQLVNLRDLAQDGFVPRNRVLELERTYTQLTGEISAETGNIGRIQRQIAELEQRRIHRQQEYQKEVRQQLSDIKREIDSLSSRLSGQDFELANVEVKAPVDGFVVGMNVFTEGGVISPGFKLMDIVPSDDMLIITGQVPVHLIDRVHVDLPVDLIFSALNQKQTPNIPGTVTQVSADRLMDERSGLPFYNIKAKVTPEGMKKLTDQQIRAGMPVEIFIKTGERSLMSYLFKPILDRVHSALSEE